MSQGQSSVSTQYSKNFGPAWLRLLIPYTFHNFVCWLEVNIILSHSKGEVCVLQNCHLSVVLMVDGPAVDCILLQIMLWHAPSKKFGLLQREVQKITCYPQPPKMRLVKKKTAIFLFLYGYNCSFFL